MFSAKRGARIGSKESKSPISLSFTATPLIDFILFRHFWSLGFFAISLFRQIPQGLHAGLRRIQPPCSFISWRVRAKTFKQNQPQREDRSTAGLSKKEVPGPPLTHCRDPHSTETSLWLLPGTLEIYALIYLVAGASPKNIGTARKESARGTIPSAIAHSLTGWFRSQKSNQSNMFQRLRTI